MAKIKTTKIYTNAQFRTIVQKSMWSITFDGETEFANLDSFVAENSQR